MPSILRTRLIHNGWGKFLLATLRLDDGTELEREIEDHGHAIAVLPYDPERRFAVLIRTVRPPLVYLGEAPTLLEAPAGMIEPGEAPDATTRREAMEEVGLALGALEPVGRVHSSPGVSTESIALYLAAFSATDRKGKGGGAEGENENIEIIELPLAELAALADRGELVDLKTLALVQTLRLRRPELFA